LAKLSLGGVSATSSEIKQEWYRCMSSQFSYPYHTTCFSSCCDKDSAIIFTIGRLPVINPPWEKSEC
jgi:hypothetical protein